MEILEELHKSFILYLNYFRIYKNTSDEDIKRVCEYELNRMAPKIINHDLIYDLLRSIDKVISRDIKNEEHEQVSFGKEVYKDLQKRVLEIVPKYY